MLTIRASASPGEVRRTTDCEVGPALRALCRPGPGLAWRDLGDHRRGEYRDDQALIVINRRLTHAQAIATHAHEVGHAVFGDRFATPANERRAWEYGASLIITCSEYADAEDRVGVHPGALAVELDVTPR